MKANQDINNVTVLGIPNQWYRKDTPTQLTGNYKDSFTDAEYLYDGWLDIVNPTYNTSTQKLGELFRDEANKQYTYPIIDLTAQEIADAKAQEQEEQAEQSYQTSIDDGRQLFARSYRRMYRRFKDPGVAPSNVLTLADVKKYMRWNESVYTALNLGSFYQAENRILVVLADNAVELASNNALRRMFEWLRDQIQTYLLTYDLR